MAFAKYAILECPLIWKKRNPHNRTHEKLISYDNKVVQNQIGSDSIFIDDHSVMIERLTIASNDLLCLYGGWHRKHYSIISFLRKPICGRSELFCGKLHLEVTFLKPLITPLLTGLRMSLPPCFFKFPLISNSLLQDAHHIQVYLVVK